MKKKIIALSILLLGMIVVVLGGCSKIEKKISQNNSDNKTEKNVLLQDKPLSNLNKIEGKTFLKKAAYSGKPVNKLSKIKWQKQSSDNSISFTRDGKVFIGAYRDSNLIYGRLYKVEKAKDNFYKLTQSSFITSEAQYEKLSDEKKEMFTSYDHNDSIPDVNKQKNQSFYSSDSYSKGDKSLYYRFYLQKDGTIVRENLPKQNIRYYILNEP